MATRNILIEIKPGGIFFAAKAGLSRPALGVNFDREQLGWLLSELTQNNSLCHMYGSVAHMVNHVRIMADQNHGQVTAGFKIVEQVKDFRLH